jgi:hypothetical protein
VIFTTPDKPLAAGKESLGQQLKALGQILKSRVFWRFAPQTAAIVGGFMAMQGLWAVPWLMNVNGASRESAAFHMLLTSGAMLTGFIAIAAFVNRLKHRGIHPEQILTVGMGVGILATALIVFDVAPSHLLWFVLGLVFSVGNLAYALLTAHFPVQISGRANTALNLAAFVGAAGLQWGFGILLDALKATGMATPEAFRWSYGLLLVMQALAWGWFLAGRKAVNQ